MGRSRWRNRNGKRRKTGIVGPQTLVVKEMTPQCPGGERRGLDGMVTFAIQELDTIVRDMRDKIEVPNGIWNEDTAVRRYLVYLSLLVDVILNDMALSAVHGNDLAVLLKARILVEYANKAIYCQDHPEYALAFTTVLEAEGVLDKLRKGGADAKTIEEAEAEVARRKDLFPQVADIKEVKLGTMMRHHTRGGDPERNDEYVWLYRAPSAILHGDPEGMRTLLPVDEHGNQHPTITLGDDYLNALVVDAGSNALIFCDTFIARFKPEDESLRRRVEALAFRFKELSVKHSVGRTDEAMALLSQVLTVRPDL